MVGEGPWGLRTRKGMQEGKMVADCGRSEVAERGRGYGGMLTGIDD